MIGPNKERRSANISLLLMAIGTLMVILPGIWNADMTGWGYGMAFLGGALALTAFFIFLMFNGRAKVWNRMFRQLDVIAKWNYSKAFWTRVFQEDLADAGIGKIVGFFFAGIFSLIGVVIFAIDTEENGVFLLIMLGIAVFFIIIGFISTRTEKKRAFSSPPEVVIAKDGLFFKNTLYTWQARPFSYLESVSIHPDDPAVLLFILRQLSGGSISIVHYHQHIIAIPIPPGQEDSAREVVEYFHLPMTEKTSARKFGTENN